ncbi:MAG TPA: hypothetical protein PK144_09415, partial [Plasticicumulans sp.]|nr:hypothetical protein [Plasticicumulans sp.]
MPRSAAETDQARSDHVFSQQAGGIRLNLSGRMAHRSGGAPLLLLHARCRFGGWQKQAVCTRTARLSAQRDLIAAAGDLRRDVAVAIGLC